MAVMKIASRMLVRGLMPSNSLIFLPGEDIPAGHRLETMC